MTKLSTDTLMLMDYSDRLLDTGIKYSRLGEDVVEIFISVISGDEIATISFADGHEERFDSSNERLIDLYDGSYTLYKKGMINQIDRFLDREDSYWDWTGE